MRGRRFLRPSLFLGVFALGLSVRILTSLEKETQAQSGPYCEAFHELSVQFDASDPAPATCPAGVASLDKSIWCMSSTGIETATDVDGSGFLRVRMGTGSPFHFRAPRPQLIPAAREVLVTSITAADFNDDGRVDLIGTASDVVDDPLDGTASPSRYVVPIVNATNPSTVDWNDPESVATPFFMACHDMGEEGRCGPNGHGFLNGDNYLQPQGTFPDMPKGGPTAVVAGHFDRGTGESANNQDVLVVRSQECTDDNDGDPSCLYNLKNCVFRVYIGADVNGAGQLDATLRAQNGVFKLQELPPQPMPGDNPSCDSDTVVNCNELGEFDWTSSTMVAVDWPDQTTGVTDGVDDILFVRSQETNPVPLLMRNITASGSQIVKFQVEPLVGLTGTPWACGMGDDDEYCKRGLSAVAVTNFDADSFPDIIYGRLDTNQVTVRRQTGLGVWESEQQLTSYGATTFIVAGDLDGGGPDVLVGTDNWNLPGSGAAVPGCDVSRAPIGCADNNAGGRTELWSSKDATLTEVGWHLPCPGGICDAATGNFGRLSNVTCHADASPYTNPAAQGATWRCDPGTHEASHGASRDGVQELTATSTDDPTPGVIYDWDTAVLLNYDDDYHCLGSATAKHPGYRSSGDVGNGSCAANTDPFDSLDLVVADGNDSQRLWVIPNRGVLLGFPTCDATGSNNWSAWSAPIQPGIEPATGTDAADAQIISACVSLVDAVMPSGTGLRVQLSNDGGETSVEVRAADLSSSNECPGGQAPCFCGSFPFRNNRFSWRARLCPTSDGVTTPQLGGVAASFRRAPPVFDARGGVTIADGVEYSTQYRNPGNAGRLLAYQVHEPEAPKWMVDDSWDLGAGAPAANPFGTGMVQRLPPDAERKIFLLAGGEKNGGSAPTSVVCPSAGGAPTSMVDNGSTQLIQFNSANAGNGTLRYYLGGGTGTCVSTTRARRLINWLRCGVHETIPATCFGRFVQDPCYGDVDRDGSTTSADATVVAAAIGAVGARREDVNHDGVVTADDQAIVDAEVAANCTQQVRSRLGGFYRATPAVLDLPRTPYYPAVDAQESAAISDLLGDLGDRSNLVIAPSHDMVHAFFTDPNDLTNPANGREVWAVLPGAAAQTLISQVDGVDDWWRGGDRWFSSPRIYDYWDRNMNDGVAPDPGSFRSGLSFTSFSYNPAFSAVDYMLDITETAKNQNCIGSTECVHSNSCNASTCGIRFLWGNRNSIGGVTTGLFSPPTLARLAPDPLGVSPAGFYVATSGADNFLPGGGGGIHLYRADTGVRAAGWPVAQNFPGNAPSGQRAFRAPPVAVDVLDEFGVYAPGGDGSHDFIIVGDTDGFVWRFPLTVPGDASVSPHYTGLQALGRPVTAPVTTIHGGTNAYYLVPAGGSETVGGIGGGKVVAVKDNLIETLEFTIADPNLVPGKERVIHNVVVTDNGCFFASSMAGYVEGDGQPCADSAGVLYSFDCLLGGALTRHDIAGALEHRAINTPLSGRAGVLTYATQRGKIVTFGTGTGIFQGGAGDGAGEINWWQDVW